MLNWAQQNQRNPMDLHTQLDYVLEEPGESERAIQQVLRTKNPAQAAVAFSQAYERPNAKYAANDKRAATANRLAGFMKGGTYHIDEDLVNELVEKGYKIKILE